MASLSPEKDIGTLILFPSEFTLVAAMNPCPCGFYGDPIKECICSPHAIANYLKRISGPLLDRIDIHVEVPAVNYKDLASDMDSEVSSVIRERVIKSRGVQTDRFNSEKSIFSNAHMQSREIRRYCRLDDEGRTRLKTAITKLGLSARAYDRILKVSRTIADLAQSESILPEHIGEAIQYRSLDRQLWLY